MGRGARAGNGARAAGAGDGALSAFTVAGAVAAKNVGIRPVTPTIASPSPITAKRPESSAMPTLSLPNLAYSPIPSSIGAVNDRIIPRPMIVSATAAIRSPAAVACGTVVAGGGLTALGSTRKGKSSSARALRRSQNSDTRGTATVTTTKISSGTQSMNSR